MLKLFKKLSLSVCILFTTILLVSACKPVQTVIQKEETVYRYVDTVLYHDSTVLVPKEVYTNVAWNYDTLHLSTSLAEASCWVDSLWLRGTITNKDKVVYKYITQTEYITKDSIVYKEKPVPYEVVKEVKNPVNWKLVLWGILATLSLCGVLYWHFRDKIRKLFVH